MGAFILLVGLMLGLTQTSMFRSWLKNQIVSRAGQYLKGRLTIDDLQGNLFTEVQLTGVLLAARQDTVLYIPKMRIDLSPARLFHRELQIDSITIYSPFAKLIQAPDSSWNVSNLIRSDSLKPANGAKQTGSSDFRILLNDFIVRDGSVRIMALDSTAPSSIKQIGIQFAIQYSDEAQQFELKKFGFSVEKPQFRLEQLSLSATRRGKKITLGNLIIQTAKNQLGGEGTYVASDSAISSGNLASKPFDFSEFHVFVPSLTLKGNPTFKIETELERDSLTVRLGVIEPPQQIDLRLDVANISKTLTATTRNQARYYASLKFANFDLAHWLGDTTMDYQASGTIAIAGKGFTPDSADFSLDVNLADLRARGRPIGQFIGSAHYASENLGGQFTASGDFGELRLEFVAQDLMKSQDFKLTLGASHLNLAPLMQNDSLQSDLNLNAQLKGSGFDTVRFNAAGQVDLSSSEIFHYKIDSMFARGSFTANSYRIDTLYAETPLGRASVAGTGNINGNNDLKYWVMLKSLSPLRPILKADSLSGAGIVSGTAGGTADSLQILSDLEFHGLCYNTFRADTIKGHLSVLKRLGVLDGTARISAQRFGTVTFVLDSLAVSSQFTRKAASLSADVFYRRGISGHIETRAAFDSTSSIAIPNLVLNFKDRHWKGGTPDTRITIRSDDYQIEKLLLTSPIDSGGGLQSISIDGLFSMAGTENLKLKVDRLDLDKLTAEFELPTRIAGHLSADMQLTGTASAPIIAGMVEIDSGLVNEFSYQALRANFSYSTEKLTWNLSLLPYQADSLSIVGFLPITLSPAKSEGAIHRDRPFEVKIRTTGLPLSVVQASGEPFKQVQGFIVADVNINNTINSPTVGGHFGLRNGKVSLPSYGVEYSDIMTSLSIHDATITLDTLQASRDQGYMTGSGSLQFDRNFLTGTVKTTQFDFVANKFYVVNHRDYSVQISGDAHLTGNSLTPTFAGHFTILHSSLFLPTLMEEAAAARAAANESMPLLVKATLKPDTLIDSTGTLRVKKHLKIDTSQADWYRNLRGQFKITIPRNTWLKSPDMNLEIGEGDIDLVKNGPDFEIFGPLKILRGQYNLYGRRFTILQGSLLFQGGAEYNPEISMQAQYVFRTAEREKKTLTLDVSGKAFSPVPKFTLDGNAIEERDAIAYVMYGRSMDELTSGQKSDAGAAQGQLAKGAVSNMLSNRLSQTLGSKLGLDVLDISSQGSLISATVTIGKYLTDDLFMSYQRSLGQNQDQGAAPGIVTLEYELNRLLSLQLLQGDERSSGLDLIFKYQH